jgi:hypothetical protein
LLKRVRAIPGKAVEAFWRGYDRKKQVQMMGQTPEASGLSIQTNNVDESALKETASAVAMLIKVVPDKVEGVDVWRLNRALDQLTIEWVRHEVPEYRMIQQTGPRWLVRVQWQGTAWESQLFHALLHFVNVAARLPYVRDEDRDLFVKRDHDHTETSFWGLELDLCQREYDPG